MISALIQYPALITHFTGYSNYSRIHYQGGKIEVVSKTLFFFQERIPYFVRIHKMALINPYYIEAIRVPSRVRMPGSVSLWDGTLLPVSRRRWGELTRGLAEMDSTLTSSLQKYSQRVGLTTRRSLGFDLFVVMTEEPARILLRQLVNQIDSRWGLYFFPSALALQQTLSTTNEQTRPTLIILEGGAHLETMLTLLAWIKHQSHLRLIPVLLTVPLQEDDLFRDYYAFGANAIVLQPRNELQFIKVFEKVLQYWLYMTSVTAKSAVAME